MLTGATIISRDISEQKKTEIKLHKNEEILFIDIYQTGSY